MRHLIIGHGEVGASLHKVLGDAMYVTRLSDTWDGKRVDVIHVCVPYQSSTQFKEVIEGYRRYGDLIIVHSSVPVGTCDRLGVIHSPIRGVHPNLEEGIRTFVKYFGGDQAARAAVIFKDLGIKVMVFPKARTTEALKLWSTTQYGRLIMLEKEIHKWCEDNDVDFDIVYTQANKDYNEGYMKLGRPEVVRPYLKHVPGPIGGHCVLPNAKLLGIKL